MNRISASQGVSGWRGERGAQQGCGVATRCRRPGRTEPASPVPFPNIFYVSNDEELQEALHLRSQLLTTSGPLLIGSFVFWEVGRGHHGIRLGILYMFFFSPPFDALGAIGSEIVYVILGFRGVHL